MYTIQALYWPLFVIFLVTCPSVLCYIYIIFLLILNKWDQVTEGKKVRHCTLSIQNKINILLKCLSKHVYLRCRKCMSSMWEGEKKQFRLNSVIFVLTYLKLIALYSLVIRLDRRYVGKELNVRENFWNIL